jgi:hypothetical protein
MDNEALPFLLFFAASLPAVVHGVNAHSINRYAKQYAPQKSDDKESSRPRFPEPNGTSK